MPIGHYYDINP